MWSAECRDKRLMFLEVFWLKPFDTSSGIRLEQLEDQSAFIASELQDKPTLES